MLSNWRHSICAPALTFSLHQLPAVFMFTAVAQILLETESCGWDTHLELDVRHETQLSEHVTKSVSVLLLAKAGLPSSSVLSTLPLTLELFLLSLQFSKSLLQIPIILNINPPLYFENP